MRRLRALDVRRAEVALPSIDWATLAQICALAVIIFVVTIFLRPASLLGVDTMIALWLCCVRYRLISSPILGLGIVLTVAACALCAAVQGSGLLVQQHPLAGRPYYGSMATGAAMAVLVFGLSPTDILTAAATTAVEALALLVAARAWQWWDTRPRPSLGASPDTAIPRSADAHLVLRATVGLVSCVAFWRWTGSAGETLVVGLVLLATLLGLVPSRLFMIAAITQLVVCAVLLIFEQAGLLIQRQDLVAALAMAGITSFRPVCDVLAGYIFLSLVAASIGFPGLSPAAVDRQSPSGLPA